MRRIRRQIPLLWTSPVPVYEISHQPTAQYLHALFALRERDALYVETPFAPQLVHWFTQMEQYQSNLIEDLAMGSLAKHLELSSEQRFAIEAHLEPDPERASEIKALFADGFTGIVPRIWPQMRYFRTVTSGSFALSMPRLEWLTGGKIPVHSGCHSSSEGIIGINLATDGKARYTLACGAAYFEFIPAAHLDKVQPPTTDIAELAIGECYEIVLTTCAGLYRYRLGDVVRISGFHHSAPVFEFLYRRGTIINLVGEKTTEYHTAYAITATFNTALGKADYLKDYCVVGQLNGGTGRYTFFAEADALDDVAHRKLMASSCQIDQLLCQINEYYRSNARESERLEPAELKLVSAGTFSALAVMRANQTSTISTSQIKTPRAVWDRRQIELLKSRCIK